MTHVKGGPCPEKGCNGVLGPLASMPDYRVLQCSVCNKAVDPYRPFTADMMDKYVADIAAMNTLDPNMWADQFK
eukprot:g57027.t1